MIDLDFPDLSNHPPPPTVDSKTFERMVIEVFIPQAIARGELTEETFITNFLNNEGRQKEPWPDFCGD